MLHSKHLQEFHTAAAYCTAVTESSAPVRSFPPKIPSRERLMLLFASILEHISFSYGRFKTSASRCSLHFYRRARTLHRLASNPAQSVLLFLSCGSSSDPTGCTQRKQQRRGTLRIQVRFKRYVEDEADLAWRSNLPPTPRRRVLTEPRGPIRREGGEGTFFFTVK